MRAPAAMIATCANGSSRRAPPPRPRPRRLARPVGRQGPAIDQTACATTATAASLSPWTQPAPERSAVAATRPRTVRAMADGSVKPSHAASPPARPARRVPMAIPSWLLAGPGRDWHSADEVGERGLVEPAAARRRTRAGNSRCGRSGRRTRSARVRSDAPSTSRTEPAVRVCGSRHAERLHGRKRRRARLGRPGAAGEARGREPPPSGPRRDARSRLSRPYGGT